MTGCKPLVSEATALPTEPQPLPEKHVLLAHFDNFFIYRPPPLVAVIGMPIFESKKHSNVTNTVLKNDLLHENDRVIVFKWST